jgi:hypothetical protein
MPSDWVVNDNNEDLLSEDNGFVDEAFGNEWEIVREPGVDPAFERANAFSAHCRGASFTFDIFISLDTS